MRARRILVLAVFLTVIGCAGIARAHGSEELEIFVYLLEEPGFFRIATFLFGGLIVLLGGYVLWKGNRALGHAGGRRAAMLGPGAVILLIGAGAILIGLFIVPDQVTQPHHQGEGGKAAPRLQTLPSPASGASSKEAMKQVISPGRPKSGSSP
ncbi:MAG: hypothetical protein O2807_05965 [bacterium]|nr:hypothetical protein [bacterium]